MRGIIIAILFIFLSINGVFASGEKEIYIRNGGYFSLEKGQIVTLQFKNFNIRKISLIRIKKNTAILKAEIIGNKNAILKPEGFMSFFKAGKARVDSSKGLLNLNIGEEAISYETEEMSITLRLEKIKNNKATFNITYHSAPPASKIWPWQRIKIITTKP